MLSFPAILVVVVVVVDVATEATVVVPVSTVVSPGEVDRLADVTVVVDVCDDGFEAVLSSGGGDASSHNAWLLTSSLTLGFPPCQQNTTQFNSPYLIKRFSNIKTIEQEFTAEGQYLSHTCSCSMISFKTIGVVLIDLRFIPK